MSDGDVAPEARQLTCFGLGTRAGYRILRRVGLAGVYDSDVMNNHLLVQAVTAVRVPLAITFAILLPGPGEDPSPLLICLALLVLQEVSDALDGALARHLGVVSRWGQVFDPFADSVSRLIVYWALAQAGLTLAVLPLVMALRDVTVAYSRLVAADHGGSVSARLSGKIKAWVQGLGAMILTTAPLYPPWATVPPPAEVSWIVLWVTAASAVEYVLAAFRGHAPD